MTALVQTVLLVGAFSGTFYLVLQTHQQTAVIDVDPLLPAKTLSPAEMEVIRLVEEHHCWTEKAPQDMRGKVPGHVVVTLHEKRQEPRAVYSKRLVKRALKSVFVEHDDRLTVHAFCR